MRLDELVAKIRGQHANADNTAAARGITTRVISKHAGDAGVRILKKQLAAAQKQTKAEKKAAVTA